MLQLLLFGAVLLVLGLIGFRVTYKTAALFPLNVVSIVTVILGVIAIVASLFK